MSLFLLAVGAVLTFAVEASAEGFNLNAIGVILMIVGGIGILFSLIVWGPNREERVVSREREVL